MYISLEINLLHAVWIISTYQKLIFKSLIWTLEELLPELGVIVNVFEKVHTIYRLHLAGVFHSCIKINTSNRQNVEKKVLIPTALVLNDNIYLQ